MYNGMRGVKNTLQHSPAVERGNGQKIKAVQQNPGASQHRESQKSADHRKDQPDNRASRGNQEIIPAGMAGKLIAEHPSCGRQAKARDAPTTEQNHYEMPEFMHRGGKQENRGYPIGVQKN